MIKLKYQTFGNAENADLYIVVMHGYGSNADDMFDITSIMSQFSNKKLFFIVPDATYPWEGDENGEGRQWFSLIDRSAEAVYRLTKNELPNLHYNIKLWQDEYKFGNDKMVLSGFSQGGLMAIYGGITMEAKIAGMVSFSGALRCYEYIEDDLISKSPAMIIHGTHDDVVPYQISEETHKTLTNLGVKSELTLIRHLNHSINQECISSAMKFIDAL